MPPTSTKSINRIQLFFRQNLDLELFEKGVEVWTRRTMIQLSFKTHDGWTKPCEGIVDTGSPITVIPAKIWRDIEKQSFCSHRISGIVPEASIEAHAGEVTASFFDKKHSSPPIRFKANLTEENRVPLIIGFEGILSQTVLHMDISRNEGYLEFP